MRFNRNSLHIVHADTHLKTKLKLPEVDSIQHVSLSPDGQVLAFIQEGSRLDCVLVQEKEIFAYNIGKHRNVLGLDWIVGSPLCDLIVVTSTDLQLLKLNPLKKKFNNVKTVTMSTACYWNCDGVVVVASPPPKQGVLHAFFLKQAKLKQIYGPKFTLDLGPGKPEIWTRQVSGHQRQTGLFPHKVHMCRLYEKQMLVHVNCMRGECSIYVLEASEAIKINTICCIEAGDYEISFKDNLLLLTNTILLETFIFDIKSDTYAQTPFCTILHNGAIDSHSKTDCVAEVAETADLHLSKSTLESVSKDIVHIVYSGLPNRNLRVVSEDLFLCAGACYRLELNCETFVHSHPDILESASFLLRRAGYKVKVFEYIRTALRSRVPLIAFSKFFEMLNANYREAALERRHIRNKSEGSSELKLETSSGLLLQSELNNFVFTPTFDCKAVDDPYLAAVLIEYMRSFAEKGIATQTGIQMLLLRVLIRAEDYTTLQQLLQYHVFTDSIEIAQVLLSLSSEDASSVSTATFQMGIDMLYRIKAKEDIAYALVSRSLILESLPYLKTAYSNTLKRHAEETQKQGDPEMKQMVKEFMRP